MDFSLSQIVRQKHSKKTNSTVAETGSTKCQKCSSRAHWTYECKAPSLVYKPHQKTRNKPHSELTKGVAQMHKFDAGVLEKKGLVHSIIEASGINLDVDAEDSLAIEVFGGEEGEIEGREEIEGRVELLLQSIN